MSKKVLVSYAREDQEQARKLCADLEAHGHQPWLDEKDLLAGQNWRSVIPRVIRQSDHVLILISSRSVSKRGYVQVEFKRALDVQDEFPDSDIFIIPVRLDACQVPNGMEGLHCVDLFSDYESGLDNILKALDVKRVSDRTALQPIPAEAPSSEAPKIYLSYAAIDNDTGWVARFAAHLGSELKKRLGRANAVSFSFDQRAVDESPDLPGDVIKNIKQSLFLICIISPAYANSQRCLRELNTFSRAVENRQDAKVFLVERETPDAEDLSKSLRRERPRRFWKKDEEGFPIVLDDTDPQYIQQINRLSHEVAKSVKCVEPLPVDLPEDECLPEISDDFPPVFLAEVTENLLPLRDDIEAYLNQAGFRVKPGKPLSMTDPDLFESALAEELAPCRVFVQLLDGNPGKTRGMPSGICSPQAAFAKKNEKTIFQWRDPDLDLKSVNDPGLLELLHGEHVMADTLEAFKKQVLHRLTFKIPEPHAMPTGSVPLVFLHADRRDEAHAKAVKQVMADQGVDCLFSVWEGKPSEILKDMENAILNSDGLIVIYGDADNIWVRKQLLQCRNLIFRREHPWYALAVYESPPPDKPDLNVALAGMHTINCRDCLDKAAFQGFFDDLVNGGRS